LEQEAALSNSLDPRPGPLFSRLSKSGGFRVVDVWESEEACNQFGEILAPILKEVGVDDPPEQIYQAHTFVSA
jgi:hypothetical protein